MDVLEAGELVRKERMEEILKETRMLFLIRKLSQGDSPEIKRIERTIEEHTKTMDAEVAETQKHHHALFNLNSLETSLLGSAVIVLVAGIVFDSDYIWRDEFAISRSVITYFIMVLILATLVFYFALTFREIKLAKKKRATRSKVAWSKMKHSRSSLLSKMKQQQLLGARQVEKAQAKIDRDREMGAGALMKLAHKKKQADEIAKNERAFAAHAFVPQQPGAGEDPNDEIRMEQGDIVSIVKADETGEGWTRVINIRTSRKGDVPTSYLDFSGGEKLATAEAAAAKRAKAEAEAKEVARELGLDSGALAEMKEVKKEARARAALAAIAGPISAVQQQGKASKQVAKDNVAVVTKEVVADGGVTNAISAAAKATTGATADVAAAVAAGVAAATKTTEVKDKIPVSKGSVQRADPADPNITPAMPKARPSQKAARGRGHAPGGRHRGGRGGRRSGGGRGGARGGVGWGDIGTKKQPEADAEGEIALTRLTPDEQKEREAKKQQALVDAKIFRDRDEARRKKREKDAAEAAAAAAAAREADRHAELKKAMEKRDAARKLKLEKCESVLDKAMADVEDPDQYTSLGNALQELLKNPLIKTEHFMASNKDIGAKIAKARQLLKELERMYLLKQAIANLNQRTIAEIKSFGTPLQEIVMVMQVVLLLLGEKRSAVSNWKAIKLQIGKTGKKSLKRRILGHNIRTTHVPEESRLVARQLLQHVQPEDIGKVSKGATTFYAWSKGVMEELDKQGGHMDL